MAAIFRAILKSTAPRVTAGLLACALPVFLTLPAHAQDKSPVKLNAAPLADSEGLAFNLPSTTLRRDSTLTLPREQIGSALFKLDISDPACLSGSGTCASRTDRINLGVNEKFGAISKTGLDLTLTPRASMTFDNDASSALVGAVVEIGEDLRDGNLKNNTWYFFAGADAEALTYAPGSVTRITGGQFHLQDQIIVGDAQAGLGYRIGDADVSLSYMRREGKSEDWKFTEDAAALSFTWKR